MATEKHSPKSSQHSTDHSGKVEPTKADRSRWLNSRDSKLYMEHIYRADYEKWFLRQKQRGFK